MRRVLLVGLLLLALALGVGGGYYAGDRWDTPAPTASGTAGPLGTVSPSPTPTPTPTEPSLPVKTPVPNNVDPLQPGLDYANRTFTVHPKGQPPVQLSIDIPQGWGLTRDPDRDDEVKFLDRLRQRGVRVQAVEPATQTPKDAIGQLVIDLRKSQAPENDVRIVEQSSDVITGDDGRSRAVGTLIYTFIPRDTLRYVIVRFIAISGGLANISMSITGIPEDAAALKEILHKASASVSESD